MDLVCLSVTGVFILYNAKLTDVKIGVKPSAAELLILLVTQVCLSVCLWSLSYCRMDLEPDTSLYDCIKKFTVPESFALFCLMGEI